MCWREDWSSVIIQWEMGVRNEMYSADGYDADRHILIQVLDSLIRSHENITLEVEDKSISFGGSGKIRFCFSVCFLSKQCSLLFITLTITKITQIKNAGCSCYRRTYLGWELLYFCTKDVNILYITILPKPWSILD